MLQRLLETFAFFKTFIREIVWFLIPVTFPIILLETMVAVKVMETESAGLVFWLPFGINFLFRPVYTGGLIWLISGLAAGEERPFRECLATGLRFWIDLLAVYIISTVIIFSGLLALIIPGLIFFARLSLAEFGVVLEKMNPGRALIASNKRVKGFTAEIISYTIILTFLLVGTDIIFSHVLSAFSMRGVGARMVSSMVFMVLSSTLTILFYRFYDLALKKEEAEGGPGSPGL